MFIFIAILLFALAALVIWGMLNFHNVLENQRFINDGWVRIDSLLILRNELLAHFQELWTRVMARPEQLTALQESLARDAAHDWEDVAGRAVLRNRIEEIAAALLEEVLSHPEADKDAQLKELRAILTENTLALRQEVQQFNKNVDIYNRLLRKPPNSFTGQHFGAIPIDSFPTEFRTF